MRVLLVGTYELGRQPVSVASPAGRLRDHGHHVAALDLAAEDYDPDRVAWADAIAISVPMHTGMRLGVAFARRARREAPHTPVAAYGLYAPTGADRTVGETFDVALAGEVEPALLAWVDALAAGGDQAGARDAAGPLVQVARGRDRFATPARDLLPPLQRYAHLEVDGEHRLVGAVETTHGCKYHCTHCPLPTVYDGALRVVDRESLLADVDQLVAGGAQHLTFADADFLNGPAHALAVARAVHERHPHLTFDATVKVEHVLAHRDVWPELAELGFSFVISAVESLDEEILAILDKGHTAADATEAVRVLRAAGIEPRPTLLPFTPWSSVETLNRIVDWVLAEDLLGNLDPIQLAIRLLVPEGSLLAAHRAFAPHAGAYDRERLQITWAHPDPGMDELQQQLEQRVADGAAADEDGPATLIEMVRLIRRAGRRDDDLDAGRIPAGSVQGRPRMTEPWFC